jgi:hypothetical protein
VVLAHTAGGSHLQPAVGRVEVVRSAAKGGAPLRVGASRVGCARPAGTPRRLTEKDNAPPRWRDGRLPQTRRNGGTGGDGRRAPLRRGTWFLEERFSFDFARRSRSAAARCRSYSIVSPSPVSGAPIHRDGWRGSTAISRNARARAPAPQAALALPRLAGFKNAAATSYRPAAQSPQVKP